MKGLKTQEPIITHRKFMGQKALYCINKFPDMDRYLPELFHELGLKQEEIDKFDVPTEEFDRDIIIITPEYEIMTWTKPTYISLLIEIKKLDKKQVEKILHKHLDPHNP